MAKSPNNRIKVQKVKGQYRVVDSQNPDPYEGGYGAFSHPGDARAMQKAVGRMLRRHRTTIF